MDWASIRQSAAEYFGDDNAVSGSGPLVRGIGVSDVLALSTDSQLLYLGPIDWTWGADDNEIEAKLDLVKTEYQYRCNQVEILLQEAGMLIERALGDVLKYDELNVERFKVMMEVVEFDKTYQQQLREQQDVNYWNGLAAESEKAANAREHFSDGSGAIKRHYVNTKTNYGQAAEYAGQASSWGARVTALAGQESALATALQYDAQLAANTADRDSHTARQNYETRSRIHQIARQVITKEIIGIKLKEMRGHGALNYNDRMREVGKRALDDFREVSARLHSIALGLREFYAVTDPSEADLESEMKGARTRVEGAVTWLRKAANALARAKMDEQEVIVRLTVEAQTDGQLLQELKQGRIVEFTTDIVANFKAAHLRAISATAETLSGDSWIDIEVASPQQKLADFTLPAVTARLGRVSSSGSLNMRDTGGGRPLFNRSPVGRWTVKATRDDRGVSIRRLHLDFLLAVY